MTPASRQPPLAGRAPVILALLIIAAVVFVDILVASDRVAVTSLMIAAPLLCGVTSSVAVTRRIGVVSVVAAAAAFIWGPSPNTWRYWIPLGVVAVGSAFAVVMARYRGNADRDARRMRVLADVAEIAQGGQPVEEIAWALIDVLVPRLVDVVRDRHPHPGGQGRAAGGRRGGRARSGAGATGARGRRSGRGEWSGASGPDRAQASAQRSRRAGPRSR